MRQDFDMETLLLALPCRLQSGRYSPIARTLAWAWFDELLRGYIDSLHKRRRSHV